VVRVKKQMERQLASEAALSSSPTLSFAATIPIESSGGSAVSSPVNRSKRLVALDSEDERSVSKVGFRCSVCRVLIKSKRLSCVSVCTSTDCGAGRYIFCSMCGHGGHAAHVAAWFNEQSVCPAVCGCSCPPLLAQLYAE
jgi:hypothetical protein